MKMVIKRYRRLLKLTSNKIIILLIFGITAFSSCMIKSGELASNKHDDAPLNEEELKERVNKHRRLMYECFKDYMAFCTMKDSSGTVTTRSLNNFKSLFMQNAKVWNDVSIDPRMNSANDYADFIYDYMEGEGVKVSFEKDIVNKFFFNLL